MSVNVPSIEEFVELSARVDALSARVDGHTHVAPEVPVPVPEPEPEPVPTPLDDTDLAIVYSPSWSTSSGTDKYGGGDHHTNQAAATATISFTGTRVQLVGATDAHHGRATVQLDDHALVTVDQRASTRSASVQFYDSGVLDATEHTVILTVEGDGTVALDRVNLNGAPTEPAPKPVPDPPAPNDPNAVFSVSGNKVLRGTDPWWFVGYNSFVWSANCGHDYEKMSAADVDDWFASMRHDGHGLVRLFFFRGWNYDRLDAAIASAREHNVYLLVTVDDAIGGCGENDKTDSWFDNDSERNDYRDHLATLLTRYKGESRIFAFEYFNEPSYRNGRLRSFYDEMGTVRDSIDPSRLMSSGTVAPYWLDSAANYRHVHESPGVDIASLHEYDQSEVLSNHLDDCVTNAAGKPLIVGEFGIASSESGSGCETSFAGRADRFRAKLDAYIRYDGCIGALAWAWQPGGSGCSYGSLDRDSATQAVLREVTK